MEDYVTRKEYEEHNRRMEDEHNRQNHRIGAVEDTVRQIGELTISVKEMAISVKNMSEEQKALRTDMEEVKNRDGQRWRKAISHIIDVALGVLVGYILKLIGIF